MKVVVVSEKQGLSLQGLVEAFKKEGMDSEFVGIERIGLFTEKDSTSIVFEENSLHEIDGVFLNAGASFTQFVEPFLDELMEKGIYCQVKPESYLFISNQPFQFATLNAKDVKIPKTVIAATPFQVNGALMDFSYPLVFRSFKGLKKTQDILMESERSLKSLLKSIRSEVDAVTIQEYLAGDLDKSLVVGDDVFNLRRKWNEKELEHAKKGFSFKLSEQDEEMAVKAARVVGADIAVVKMIEGTVIGVSQLVDFGLFRDTLGTDVCGVIARFYARKLKGE